jgi:hypothetical protein
LPWAKELARQMPEETQKHKNHASLNPVSEKTKNKLNTSADE